MRARAIETGCFVFAPAQVGTHKGSNRKTYGHSIAVAPWGEVLADAGGEKAGFVIAEVDLGQDRRGAQDGAVADARPEIRRAGAAQGRRSPRPPSRSGPSRAAIRCTIAIFGSLIMRAS